MLYSLLVAFVVIFVAEQGDKTQILAFALSTKYKAWQVLAGIGVATLLMNGVFALAGRLVGNFIPSFWLWVASGVAFVGFGIWALLENEEEESAEADPRLRGYGPVLTSAGLFFLAELGDQSELITMVLAANPAGPLLALGAAGPALQGLLAHVGLQAATASSTGTLVGVWLGSALGMLVADSLGIIAGRLLHRSLPELLLRRIAGWVMVAIGALVLIAAVATKLT
jgi:putative Ca2+/H+ antiporter (TMEM165/GDT1 family)